MTKTLLTFILLFGSFQVAAQNAPFKYLELPNGQRQIVPASDTRAAQQGQQIWNKAMSSTASGQVEVGRSVPVKNPAGNPVELNARGRLPAPAVAAAVGRVATAAAKSITPIAVGFAIYDLAVELGINANSSPTGLVYQRPDPSVCTVSPCYAWDGRFGRFPTALAACEPEIASAARYFGTTTSNHQAILSGADYAACSATHNGAGYVNNTMTSGDVYRAQVPPSATAPLQTLTEKQFLDTVGAKTSWPANSKINDAVLADPSPELQVPVSIIASGSASSPGATSSTVNSTNNTTSNSTTTYNHQYAGDVVTTTVITNNITTNNSTGAVTDSSTTTSTPAPTTPEPNLSVADSALPAVPKLYEPVYPKGFAGVWSDKKDQLKSAPLTALASSLMPNVASSGACPAMPVDLTFASWASFGVRDVAPPCYVWDWGKAFVILGALLLARALIFGG